MKREASAQTVPRYLAIREVMEEQQYNLLTNGEQKRRAPDEFVGCVELGIKE